MTGVILNKTEHLTLQRNSAVFESPNVMTREVHLSSLSHDKDPAIYSVEHDTIYEYSNKVLNSKHLYRMQPINDLTQAVLSYELTSSPGGSFYNFTGVFGNNATVLEIKNSYLDLRIHAKSIVAVSEPLSICAAVREERMMIPLIWMPWDRVMMQAFLLPEELPESELEELSEYAMSFVARNEHKINAVLHDINNTIYKEYKYLPNSTTLATTPYEVFHSRQGVCQDFANLFICLARLLNVPARYRVGYLYTGGQYDHLGDHDQTHAWVEVYLPSVGWKGFDPTNGCLAGKSHIRVASGRHYRDASPASGVIFGQQFTENMYSSVKVVNLNLKK